MSETLLAYYEENAFNPVPIRLSSETDWRDHAAKRRNLYERHLGIPVRLLNGSSVLEFGCNSGENALVLAVHGARLTLVEPHAQTLVQIRHTFEQYDLDSKIEKLVGQGVDEFQSDRLFDLVLAEGFLYTLNNRDEILDKLCKLIAPGGMGVLSFNDRVGGTLEILRRALLHRICQLSGIEDIHSEASLLVTRSTFGPDWNRIPTSRTIEAWWKDNLVNPFYTSPYLWSYHELLPRLGQNDCQVSGTSPSWSLADAYSWYKDVPEAPARHDRILSEWSRNLGYFLTGLRPDHAERESDPVVVTEAHDFVDRLSDYTVGTERAENLFLPSALHGTLSRSADPRIRAFSRDLSAVISAFREDDHTALQDAYRNTELLHDLWGTPYHYLSFRREHI